MKYDDLKSEIQAIAAIAQSVPAEFQQRCFDILLTGLLRDASNEETSKQRQHAEHDEDAAKKAIGKDAGKARDGDSGEIPKTAALRVFMQRQNISDDVLKKVLFVEDKEVHWVREPAQGKVAAGQIEWALLLALREAILGAALAVDPEAVRSICQEKGFYDIANFAANFKNAKNKLLFKGPMVAQGEARNLTVKGEKALAELLRTLAGGNE
jgi:hypothetical protein